MSFLKKLTEGLKKAGPLVTGYGGLITLAIPGDKDDKIVAQITTGLADVERAVTSAEIFAGTITNKNLSGEDKMRASGAQIAGALAAAFRAAGRKIKNEQQFIDDCGRLGGVYADILNDLE